MFLFNTLTRLYRLWNFNNIYIYFLNFNIPIHYIYKKIKNVMIITSLERFSHDHFWNKVFFFDIIFKCIWNGILYAFLIK